MNAIDTLLIWYSKESRDLPWRTTRDPYKTWISEIILQQTRVNQGLPYYEGFVSRFETVYDLASASERDVLRQWQGLGYYSRARNLHKSAKIIVHDLGKFPKTYKDLIKLPGIGPYTAAAISSIAFKEPVPAIDGNAIRVYTRLFQISGDPSKAKVIRSIRSHAADLISHKHPGEFNQAIMEIGSGTCTPTRPSCHQCPLNTICQAYQYKTQDQYPHKKTKTRVRNRFLNYFVIRSGAEIGMRERKSDDIWKGLYDFHNVERDYAFDSPEQIDDPYVLAWLNLGAKISDPVDKVHLLSHQRLNARFFEITIPETIVAEPNTHQIPSIHFYSKKEILDLPKPKLVEDFLKDIFEKYNL